MKAPTRTVNPHKAMRALVSEIKGGGKVLSDAQHMADALLPDAENHCAITMSSMLVFYDLFPVKIYAGQGNLVPDVHTLSTHLIDHGWSRVQLGHAIEEGDLGVVWEDKGFHHIYLVLDATDQEKLLVADNQGPAHIRPVKGGGSFSPTDFFQRAPEKDVVLHLVAQLVG